MNVCVCVCVCALPCPNRTKKDDVGGRRPSPSSWGPPVNRSCAFRCQRLVSATLALRVCDVVWVLVMVRVLLSSCPCVLSGTKSGPRDGTIPLGSLAHDCQLSVIALLGAVPLVGRSLTSRYQGPPKRLSGGAGRPMGPSTPLCFSQSCAVFVLCVLVWVCHL